MVEILLQFPPVNQAPKIRAYATHYNPGDPIWKIKGVVTLEADYPEESEEALWLRRWSDEQPHPQVYRIRETEVIPEYRDLLNQLPPFAQNPEHQ